MRNYVPLKTAQNRRGDQGNPNSDVYIAVEKPDLRRKDLLVCGTPVGVRCFDR